MQKIQTGKWTSDQRLEAVKKWHLLRDRIGAQEAADRMRIPYHCLVYWQRNFRLKGQLNPNGLVALPPPGEGTVIIHGEEPAISPAPLRRTYNKKSAAQLSDPMQKRIPVFLPTLGELATFLKEFNR